MPVSYRIDTVRRLVRMRAWGTVSNADLRDYYHRLVVDPRFQPSFQSLVDICDVTAFTVDCGVIAETASWSVFDVGTRRAVIASSDVAYGLARMFSLRAEAVGQNVHVFRTAKEAVGWINSPINPGREPDISSSAPGVSIRAA